MKAPARAPALTALTALTLTILAPTVFAQPPGPGPHGPPPGPPHHHHRPPQWPPIPLPPDNGAWDIVNGAFSNSNSLF